MRYCVKYEGVEIEALSEADTRAKLVSEEIDRIASEILKSAKVLYVA